MQHPLDSAFIDFVIGALGEAESAAFVAHVSDCEPCSEKLAREAKTELAILEIGDASKARAEPIAGLRVRGLAPRLTPDRVRTSHNSTTAFAGGPSRELPGRRRRWIAVGVAGLALAATIALLVRPARHPGGQPTTTARLPAASGIPPVVCPDGREQEKCIEDAHRHGLVVGYPAWAGPPPLGGGPAGKGPNEAPSFHRQM